ncbi:MAG TPA: FAD-dependent oxidoreductase [Thermomicrobiales bacterium]|jgi:sarcosine oxidase subunit alpha|nr:FAD-dependent oxidoreductase [Thermomicrobiales bacterium]
MSAPRIAVVGGGPAGLAAAIAAAEAGARVAVFDEWSEPGGELRYRVARRHLPGFASAMRPAAVRADLLTRLAATNATIATGAIVWGIFDDGALTISRDGASEEVRPDAVVLATGSTDAALPFPGATLPGVFTSRAVQLLLNRWRVLPGRRFAIVGGGAEGAEVAADIRLVGADVAVVADGRAAVAATGQDGVETVVVNGRSHPVDVIVVAAGRHPDIALAQMAGCPIGVDAALGGWMPRIDDRLQVPDRPLFVAGNAAGICDLATALAEGRLAGLAAALRLGLLSETGFASATERERSALVGRFEARRRLEPTFVQTYR